VKQPIAVAFTGPSGSGKTTLIQKIAQHLIPTMKLAIVKHDPKDKALFDTEGKDSDIFTKTGAEVIVTSPTRTTYFSQRHQTLEEIIRTFQPFELLLVEGLKELPLPRIAIFRHQIDESYLPYIEALAIDDTIQLKTYHIPSHITLLNLNDVEGIIEWIFTHAKKLPQTH